MNLYDQLNEVFREVFADDSIELTPETTADDIEGWDSLSHVNLMIAVELKFGIEFTQKEIRSFNSVNQIMDIIIGKI
ncbi:MAG: acyl carrier protein [Candidatus Methanofastidiosa archaeon]|nr:acyl carrier protein [Candidatus Methanofastidiosa archaeon]